jgi:hypothetical protein
VAELQDLLTVLQRIETQLAKKTDDGLAKIEEVVGSFGKELDSMLVEIGQAFSKAYQSIKQPTPAAKKDTKPEMGKVTKELFGDLGKALGFDGIAKEIGTALKPLAKLPTVFSTGSKPTPVPAQLTKTVTNLVKPAPSIPTVAPKLTTPAPAPTLPEFKPITVSPSLPSPSLVQNVKNIAAPAEEVGAAAKALPKVGQAAGLASKVAGAAGAAEAGGGLSTIASIASSLNPALKGVTILASVATAAVTVPEALKGMAEAALDAQKSLAEVSASMAKVFAQQEMRDIRRNRDIGEREAPAAKELADALGDLKDATKEQDILIKNWTDKAEAFFVRAATWIVKHVTEPIAKELNKISDNTENKDDKGSPFFQIVNQISQGGLLKDSPQIPRVRDNERDTSSSGFGGDF